MDGGLFIISLDFELHWGVFDRPGMEYNQNLMGARKAVPLMLKQFEQFDIHATWACVGLLFAKSKAEIEKWSPEERGQPDYKNKKYSAYKVHIGNDENSDPLHFAANLIEKVRSVKGQEIATHTFSHYYCLEEGQTIEQFEADIKAAIEAAKANNVRLYSIVFPRNQVNGAYLSVLKKHGIKCYRGTASGFYYNSNRTKKYNRIGNKALRLLDSYFNIAGHHAYDLYSTGESEELINIKGSRFLRPYTPALSFMEPLKLRRIKKSMEYAAKNNEVYHLWWHPHNFGTNTKKNILMLKNILEFYTNLKKKYGMRSCNMKEANQFCRKNIENIA